MKVGIPTRTGRCKERLICCCWSIFIHFDCSALEERQCLGETNLVFLACCFSGRLGGFCHHAIISWCLSHWNSEVQIKVNNVAVVCCVSGQPRGVRLHALSPCLSAAPYGTGGAVAGHVAGKWGAWWDNVMLPVSGVPDGTGSCCQ